MKLNIVFCILIMFSVSAKIYSQTTYVCFENDKNKNLRLWVSFDRNDKAQYVKYAGQSDSIQLIYSGIRKDKNDGGIPAFWWAETYKELYKGKITGKYVFTNAGTYSLDVTYTRKKDGKEFYFKVIDSTSDENYDIRKTKPCF